MTLDKVTERFLGKRRIGTTGRGIGPTYADKMNRIGIRDPGPVRREDPAPEGRGRRWPARTSSWSRSTTAARSTVDEVVDDLLGFADRLRRCVADTALLLNAALDRGETVLLEGGQGTLLDVDHGTYPFVTSSNPTAGGACTGSGIRPDPASTGSIGDPQGVHDARGRGAVPDRAARRRRRALRKIGGEFGTTTGRPRRCGWYDASIARYATRVNGVTDFFLTKLDVLTGCERSRCAWPTRSTGSVPTRCR